MTTTAPHARGTGKEGEVPTKIVFSADTSVVVIDEPHEVVTKLKEGTIQFAQMGADRPVHVLNPAQIVYLETTE
jgi:hypothetical protein